MAWKEWDYLEVLTSADLNGNFAECVRLDEVQTLTNKTLTTPILTTPTITNKSATGTDAGTETLQNKTLTSPTITNKTSTGTDSGTETLVNKTLTSPVIAAMGAAFTIPAAASTPAANTMVNESIIKAWGFIHMTAGGASLISGYNVDSVLRTDTGQVKITFKRAFAANNYCIVASCSVYTGAAGYMVIEYSAPSRTSSYCWLQVVSYAGSQVDQDIMFIVMGAQ
jgi:hypothetical protein